MALMIVFFGKNSRKAEKMVLSPVDTQIHATLILRIETHSVNWGSQFLGNHHIFIFHEDIINYRI